MGLLIADRTILAFCVKIRQKRELMILFKIFEEKKCFGFFFFLFPKLFGRMPKMNKIFICYVLVLKRQEIE